MFTIGVVPTRSNKDPSVLKTMSVVGRELGWLDHAAVLGFA